MFTQSDFVLALFFIFCSVVSGNSCEIEGEGVQLANTVQVEKGVFTFYWFIQSKKAEDGRDVSSIPLFVITGSQAVSASGYHMTLSAGPFDKEGNERPESLTEEYHLLFIDGPIGTGFSYSENNKYFSTNTTQVAEHFAKTIRSFYDENPQYRDCSTYLYSESVGTTYIPDTALLLLEETDPSCKINFHGVFLASPFIEPLQMIKEWGPYLYSRGYLDGSQMKEASKFFDENFNNSSHGSSWDAYGSYSSMEQLIKTSTSNVNFCNLLANENDSDSTTTTTPMPPSTQTTIVTPTSSHEDPTTKTTEPTTTTSSPYYSSTTGDDYDESLGDSANHDGQFNYLKDSLSRVHKSLFQWKGSKEFSGDSSNGPEKEDLEIFKCTNQGDIDEIMNEIAKKKLRCKLSSTIKFGSHDKEVKEALASDMLSSASESLVKLLNSNKVKVTIITGMQDLFSSTAATIKWLENLDWRRRDNWVNTQETFFMVSQKYCQFINKGFDCKNKIGYVKKFNNLSYYSLIPAGHYMFKESPAGVKTIINRVLNLKN